MKWHSEAPQLIVKQVKLPTRVTLPYVEQGEATGVPVLFLHGFAGSRRSFEPVWLYLSEAVHAFALTLRGHGNATRPEDGYRLDDFAADVVAFMDGVGLETAVFVGHSMGAAVAQRLAADYPARTLGLVLISACVLKADNLQARAFWESTVSQLEDPVDPAFVREFLLSTLARPIAQPLFDAMVAESLKVPARVWQAAWQARLAEEAPGELGRIEAPTLIVWGEQDTRCPRSDQEVLAAEIAHARRLTYSNAGHGLLYTEPKRLASDIVAFVADLSG